MNQSQGVDASGGGSPRQSKSVRTMRWRAARTRTKWQNRGWEAVAQSNGPLRTTMIFERPVSSRRGNVRVAVLVALILVLGLGGVAAAKLAPSAFDQVVDRVPGISLDGDHDGIPDARELEGWRTQDGDEFRTDPTRHDTDGDGLSDGDEAGPVVNSDGGDIAYAGLSDPRRVDTDEDGLSDAVETGYLRATDVAAGTTYLVANPLVVDTDEDGIGDGDEYFLDLDPVTSDTDADGLPDEEELSFGSDPTLANADDDDYSDLEEYELATNPLSYDLTGDEKIDAGEAGLKYGDCIDCALDAGLRLEQIESAEYLAGHFVSGVAVYGDFRDFAVNVWEQRFIGAGIAALGLLPFIGDSTKAVKLLTTFASRGDRAAQAVRAVLGRLPLSTSAKNKILAALPSAAGKLPIELAGGPQNYVVYKGDNYVGITNDFARRQAEHARAGRSFIPEPIPGATGLSRGEARSIEQACIDQGGLASAGGSLENRINSISPSLQYHAAAVEFGLALLTQVGGSCPVPPRT
jgi:hypothetical protein